MADPYIGEIRVFAGSFAPQGWAFCDGSLLAITDYEPLFNLIGTTYGGDGQLTFGLPDLRSQVAVGSGQGPGIQFNYILGETGGVIGLNASHVTARSLTTGVSLSRGLAANPSHGLDAVLANTTPGTTVLACHHIIALYGIYPSPT